MGVTGVIVLQKALQLDNKCRGAGKAATGQKATMQDPKEQLSLIEPEFEDDRYTILEVSIGKKSE
jgi:hypothetical protein